MSSPLPFLEEQAARKADLLQRIEMMKNHLSGAHEDATGSYKDHEDVTQREIEKMETEIANIDESIARMTHGNG